MIPTDPYHQQLADWRIEVITRLEQDKEGCHEHGRIN